MDLGCTPVEYAIDPEWPDAWRKPLYAAVQMWETVTGRDFIETETGGVYIMWANTEKIFGKNVQGAAWGGSTDPLREFSLVYIDQRLEPGKRLRKVITHEIGHALGLDHNEYPSSMMDYKVRGDAFIRKDLETATRCLPVLAERGQL